MFSILLGRFLGISVLLGCMVDLCLTFKETAKQLFKMAAPSYVPIKNE